MTAETADYPNEFELRDKDGITYLACPPFEAEGFTAAFSTRSGTVEGEPFEATSGRFLTALGVPEAPLATCRQVHSRIVRIIESDKDVSAPPEECDALTTDRTGVLLGIKTADCVPVLIADRRTGAVAAIHAGWRGTASRIVERTFAAMIGSWATRRGDCIAAIGPAICAGCYEVGGEVVARFRQEFGYAKRFISNEKGEKAHVDLKTANAIQLRLVGMQPEQIYMSDLCTKCDNDRFFSFRVEGIKAGRMIAVVGNRVA